jgi:hypothetical protein
LPAKPCGAAADLQAEAGTLTGKLLRPGTPASSVGECLAGARNGLKGVQAEKHPRE